MHNERIELITKIGDKKDADGFIKEEIAKKVEIFASVKSVKRNEFYEAARSGIKVNMIFVINPDDYKLGDRTLLINGEEKKVCAQKVSYDNTEYLIKRCYKINNYELELICEEVE